MEDASDGVFSFENFYTPRRSYKLLYVLGLLGCKIRLNEASDLEPRFPADI